MKKNALPLCFACACTFALSGAGCSPNGKIKNVILVIGDGMGTNHIENARTYFDLSSPDFLSDKKGEVLTYSYDNSVTDSAAAASAMATGQKVRNSSISMDIQGEKLTSISSLAKNAGKKVGVITTDTLDGATPAAFSSHASDRNESEQIAKGQAKSGIDLFMGKATSAYQTTYSQLFTQSGYDLLFTPPSETQLASEKLTVLLSETRSSYNENIENNYNLKDMAAFAVDFLENEKGYFLMIEGAYIDKYSHSNDITSALCEVRALFDTVEYLYNRVGKDTAIIITADHETGKLRKANDKTEISNRLYASTNHTATAVPYYLKNCQWNTDGAFIDNTDIFKMCKQFLNV